MRSHETEGEQVEASGPAPHSIDTDYVVNLVHDLKSPLSVITLEASMLERRIGESVTADTKRAIKRIERNAEFLDRMVRDLLDASACESGKLTLKRDPVELGTLLRNVVARRSSTEVARIQLSLDGRVIANIDGLRIERVVENLVQNALKYTPAGSTIGVSLERRDGLASINVTDSGPGLTTQQATYVFDKHRRGSNTASREGSGIGLFASRIIVEAHGGRIGVESVPGHGALFHVELPLVPEEPTVRRPTAYVSTAPLRGRHLLLVDDELGQVAPLAEILSDEGLLVTTALNGHDALQRLMEHKPDLVALDVQMPGISGLELLRLIHDRWPDLPVVLVTAFTPDHPGIAAAIRTPATWYVGKPVDLAQLLSTLVELVRAHAPSDASGEGGGHDAGQITQPEWLL